MTWLDYAVLILYFVSMIVIGLWAMRKVKGQEDYFMGGRGFGKLLQTFAAFGAGTGAHEPVTVGRTGWTSGLSGVWSALMWLFVTPIYWITGVWYRRMRHLTLGDWFVERYESKGMGAAYSLFAVTFYMFFLSTMFSAIAKFAVPLMGMEQIGGVGIEFVIIPVLAVIVIVYGVLGGLTAAYYTDLIQGVFIILLSVLLIPFGLWALVKEHGDPETQGVMDGFSIMHERVPADYFSLFSGPSAGEFPIQYIIALTLLVLIGIVVQPHFISTGGGSAKSERDARIGLVTGNFLKRLCTVGWALTALISLALLAGNAEIAADPDKVWGVAAREILGPVNLGLVGLMLACLMAAMMSSADTYMIVTSALITKNVYAAYINPEASDRKALRVARLTGLAMIVGASFVAMTMSDVFGQFKMAVELPILFAAPFWIGMYWRRATRTAAWVTIAFSFTMFFVLPNVIPVISPSLRAHAGLTATTNVITTTTTRAATPADVAKHEAWVEATTEAHANRADALSRNDTVLLDKSDAALKKLGSEPANAPVGEQIELTTKSGGQAIFWSSVSPVGDPELELVEERVDGNVKTVTQRHTGKFEGAGALNLDFLLYYWMGFDLSNSSKATMQSLRLPPRLFLPFVVLILVSLITRRNSQESLDRYYVKMKTEVNPDPQADRENLEESYRNPKRFETRRLLPGTNFEMLKPTKLDVFGFMGAIGVCILVIALLGWLAGIGA
jgi:SSS family solute:Na+ symporter